jgi:hypothetical protein
MKFFPYDPSDTCKNIIIRKPYILTFYPKMMIKFQAAQAIPVNTDPRYSKELQSNINIERRSPYF